MDGGAVASIVSLMKSPASAAEEEYCVAALYGMSRGSHRFSGLVKAAGAERVLMRVTEGRGGELWREMVKKTLRAMGGEDDDESGASMPMMGFTLDGNSSVVSEGMMSHRRRPAHHGNPVRMNSADF